MLVRCLSAVSCLALFSAGLDLGLKCRLSDKKSKIPRNTLRARLCNTLIFLSLVFCFSLVFPNEGKFFGVLSVFSHFSRFFKGFLDSEGVKIPWCLGVVFLGFYLKHQGKEDQGNAGDRDRGDQISKIQKEGVTIVKLVRAPPPVGALNRCNLSNWRFNPETVHFLSSKRPFLPTMFVSKCYKTKHFGQDSLFHKKPKQGRKNHYFYSVIMGKGRNQYKNHDLGPAIIET